MNHHWQSTVRAQWVQIIHVRKDFSALLRCIGSSYYQYVWFLFPTEEQGPSSSTCRLRRSNAQEAAGNAAGPWLEVLLSVATKLFMKEVIHEKCQC